MLSDALPQNRGSHWRSSVKKGVLKNIRKVTENTCARFYFLIKLQVWGLNSITRDSRVGLFLWIVWNFEQHICYRVPPDDCFSQKSSSKQLFWNFLNNPWKAFVQKQPPEVLYRKKMFLKVSQISQESTCVGIFF